MKGMKSGFTDSHPKTNRERRAAKCASQRRAEAIRIEPRFGQRIEAQARLRTSQVDSRPRLGDRSKQARGIRRFRVRGV